MNPQSLHALIIDRHFGELSPEAAELLEYHLERHPAAREEAGRILQSVAATGDAMVRHPELSRVGPSSKAKAILSWRSAVIPWMMRAAALLLLAAGAAAVGYIAGRSGSSAGPESSMLAAVSQPTMASPKVGPWARYRVSFDPMGTGMKVVRVDVPNPERKSLR